jgi:hypothetical protein
VSCIEEKLTEISNRLDRIERDLLRITQILRDQDSHQHEQQQPFVHQTKCSLCGLDWKGVMGYVCLNQYCPIQTKTSFFS